MNDASVNQGMSLCIEAESQSTIKYVCSRLFDLRPLEWGP